MAIQTIPLRHLREVIDEPVVSFKGEPHFVMAWSYSEEDWSQIDKHHDSFSHRLIAVDLLRYGRKLSRRESPNPYIQSAAEP